MACEELQVRSFGKENAACVRYKDAVLRTQSWGLKSAIAGGLFTTFNGTIAPGARAVCAVHCPQSVMLLHLVVCH